jgi:hypothetical protein
MSGRQLSAAAFMAFAASAALCTALGTAPALASGGTPPPPLSPGPCATITMKDPQAQNTFTSNNTLNANVTSCSSLTQPGLAVGFDSAPFGSTNSDRFLFSCGAPENVIGGGSISLSPGSTVGVTCHNVGSDAIGGDSSGPGVATVYSNCASSWVSPGQSAFPYLRTLTDPNQACTQSLASTSYVWAVILSTGGGGQVFCCPRK